MPSIIQRAFSGGELALSLGARADLATYTTGLRRCRNFIVQEHGGAANRSGSEFLEEVKDSTVRAALMPFVISADASYAIEVGNAYLRFYKNGARLENPPGTPVEVATPYATADLLGLQWSQSADVMTITSLLYRPRELRRVSDTNWQLTTVSTAPSIAAPTSVGGGGAQPGTLTLAYLVTAVKADTYEESVASASFTHTLVLEPTPSDPIATTWSAVAGAVEYRVYKDPYGNGVFGLIGSTPATFFNDVGFLADFAQTPPIPRDLFTTAGNFPATSAYYQQRRLFANTVNEPERNWGSRIGFYSNFSIRSPLQDDDAISFVMAANDVQPVRYLIGLRKLLILTGAGEWKILGDGEGGALLPTAINPDQQGYTGSAFVRPVILGQTVIFLQARASKVRGLRVDAQVDGVGSQDLTLFAPHLFRGYTITRLALAQNPDSVVWAVRSDGVLLGLTYLPEQQVFGWHRHDTGAGDVIEDVCVVPEATEDAVYLLVRRLIGGNTKRYVERLRRRQMTTVADDAWFVDSGVSYAGAPTTSITGLAHLEGRTVKVLADGAVPTGTFVVSGGAITLPAAASKVRVGLGITAQLETLDLDVAGSDIRDRAKKVNEVTAIVEASSRGFKLGPDANNLRAHAAAPWEPSGTVDGAVETKIPSRYEKPGRVFLEQTDPLPVTVLGLIPHVELGG